MKIQKHRILMEKGKGTTEGQETKREEEKHTTLMDP